MPIGVQRRYQRDEVVVQNVAREGGLARARNPRHHAQPRGRHAHVDALQVVSLRAAQFERRGRPVHGAPRLQWMPERVRREAPGE